ncbi:MAG TPA: hypothetical protein VM389_09730, partial [Phycisphaerae bacterium]|nr:hypothetical protein [Phycisphaerae bacterium]
MLPKAILTCLFLTAAVQAQQEQWLQYRTVHPSTRQLGSCAGPTPRLIARPPGGVALPEFTGDKQLFTKWSSPMDKAGFR